MRCYVYLIIYIYIYIYIVNNIIFIFDICHVYIYIYIIVTQLHLLYYIYLQPLDPWEGTALPPQSYVRWSSRRRVATSWPAFRARWQRSKRSWAEPSGRRSAFRNGDFVGWKGDFMGIQSYLVWLNGHWMGLSDDLMVILCDFRVILEEFTAVYKWGLLVLLGFMYTVLKTRTADSPQRVITSLGLQTQGHQVITSQHSGRPQSTVKLTKN